MSTKYFIPQVWSAAILEKFRHDAVITALANREYEGALAYGNLLHIPGIVDVAIKDYQAAGRTTTPDEVSDTEIELLVNQAKNFDFLIDDIDRAQSKYSFEPYTQSAAAGLVEDAERFLMATALKEGTKVKATTPSDYNTAYAAVLALWLKLNKNAVPQQGRYLVVSPEFGSALLGPDSKLVRVDTSGTDTGLRQATIGTLLGFTVLMSPFFDGDKPQAIALHSSALAYVSQIDKTEAMRADNSFKDRLRGLHVYGGKVVRPDAVLVLDGQTPPAPKPPKD